MWVPVESPSGPPAAVYSRPRAGFASAGAAPAAGPLVPLGAPAWAYNPDGSVAQSPVRAGVLARSGASPPAAEGALTAYVEDRTEHVVFASPAGRVYQVPRTIWPAAPVPEIHARGGTIARPVASHPGHLVGSNAQVVYDVYDADSLYEPAGDYRGGPWTPVAYFYRSAE